MLKIFGVPISVHTRKVIVAVRAKQLAFEIDPVIPFNPPPGWDRLSPTGKIPVIADGDFELADSSVICAYLEQTHPHPALLPTDAKERARALWLEEYCDSTLFREVVHGLFFQNVIRPKILQQETDRSAIDAILTSPMPKVFAYLEGVVAERGAGGFLVGQQMTLADIALVSNLVNYCYLGYRIDTTRFPKLAAWFRHMWRVPSIATTLHEEQPVIANMGLDQTAIELMPVHA